MFDELHDPTPPSADSSQFAAVAERAAGMRRRRNTILGSISAVAIIGIGALGVAAMNNSGTDDSFGTATTPGVTSAVPSTSTADVTTTVESETSTSSTSLPETEMTTPPNELRDLALGTTPVLPDPRRVGTGIAGCNGVTRCDFANLNDGRLGQLNSPAGDGEPYVFTVYDTTGGASTSPLDRDFTPPGASLLAIGPGDIAYIWWPEQTDGDPVGSVSAFEIAGGRLVRTFSDVVGASGDTELIPTRNGFVPLGCCGQDAIRPPTDAEVRVPWVDSNGDPIAADDRAHFSVAIGTNMFIAADRPGDNDDGAWTISWNDPVRGMPFLWELNDGSAVIVADGAEATSDPVFLLADGTTRTVASPGTVVHVIADGRFIVSLPNSGEHLIDVRPDATSVPDPVVDFSGETPTTTVDSPRSTVPPSAPARPVVAIDGNGDAVYFTDGDFSSPVLIADGFDPDEFDPGQEGPGPNALDAVAVSEVGDVAFVSACCEPVAGAIEVTTLSGEPVNSGPGYAPSASPTGDRIAVAEFGGGLSVRRDRVIDGVVNIPGDAQGGESFSAWDSMWIDENTVAVLGIGNSGWEIQVFDVRPESASLASVTTIGPFDGFDDGRLQFAGHPTESTIGVHQAETATVTLYSFDGSDLTQTGTRDLAEAVTSIWYGDSGTEIIVGLDRSLIVGGATVPGEYLWARN